MLTEIKGYEVNMEHTFTFLRIFPFFIVKVKMFDVEKNIEKHKYESNLKIRIIFLLLYKIGICTMPPRIVSVSLFLLTSHNTISISLKTLCKHHSHSYRFSIIYLTINILFD